jgi:hypothetical protein
MKAILVVAAMIFSASGWAITSFQDGTWEGKGTFTSQSGQQTSYTEATTVKSNVITLVLTMGRTSETYVIKVQFERGQFFTATINDTKEATGYCGSNWCHLQAKDGSTEMTVRVDGDTLQELGSYTEHGQTGWWESSLTKK